ncbi:MAG TPA: metallophosphoesterase family protein, partial [Gammaproteobacteria bacterium]
MRTGSRLRVAILSDTHGELDARIAEQVARCDYAVHAGDVGNAAVLAALHPRLGEVLAVRGNNDIPAKWPRAERAVLETLPESRTLDLPGGVLAVTHGHRAGGARERHARLRRQFPDARAIVYGHSHRVVCDLNAPVWVLNPGAAGRARTFGGPSLLILVAGRRVWR